MAAETIAGKYFPSLFGGAGGMVLITDGGARGAPELHAYVSKSAGDMTTFVAASGVGLGPGMHPAGGPAHPGSWANYQVRRREKRPPRHRT